MRRLETSRLIRIYTICTFVIDFFITKTCLYNFDPLKPHFYIVKLGFRGVYIIFLISAQNLIVFGFNVTSTLVGHFVSSPREREKRDRRDSRGDEREGRKRNRNENEETEEIKTFTLYPYLLQGLRALPNRKQK